MSKAGEAKPSRGPKGAARLGEADCGRWAAKEAELRGRGEAEPRLEGRGAARFGEADARMFR